jgi:hypothetical protein
MSHSDDEDDVVEAGDCSESPGKKQERKRNREKQRRSDLAEAFAELGALLSKIEPDEADADSTTRRRRRKSGMDSADASNSGDASGMPRLDLIGRTLETLRKLHRENLELKHEVHQNGHGGGDDNKVR